MSTKPLPCFICEQDPKIDMEGDKPTIICDRKGSSDMDRYYPTHVLSVSGYTLKEAIEDWNNYIEIYNDCDGG